MLENDFSAILNFKSHEDGGRLTSAKSGYRPAIKFPFSEKQTSGTLTFIATEYISPGETAEAQVKLLSANFFENQLHENQEFEFREGNKIIGTGRIVKIYNSALNVSR